MRIKKAILFVLALVANFAFAQDVVKMTSNYGSENSEIQDLLDFENIYMERLNFKSEKLKGKFYVIGIEEFKSGKLVNTAVLFNGTETDYFKIGTDEESLKFFFKLSNGQLKTYIRGKKFGSKKSYFKLTGDADKYALKDFFGSKQELSLVLDQKNAVFALITPTIHADGSGSYCEVAQSDIMPEKLGEHFKIPHYFLVTITFK
ncbi:hypothetical protein [Pedobacter xixiisoli]|uniref:Uncharacterized protein n=1 Tax=Pedobacter xixiisoli TaxID=1476464 RepID=A0A286AA32_9SPHI|nr:hypothetical protein [Pedobacter xixiisoli]SOD18770.1 hypothetical protein SAMN06297358_3177 [Pedobacter xixiisoli]